MRRHRISGPLALVAAVTLLTACSDDGSDDSADSRPSQSADLALEPTETDQPSQTEEPDTVESSESAEGGIDAAAQKYVDAVADKDLDALVAAFHPDAQLIDVGREFNGHDEIRAWADNEVIGGKLTVLEDNPKSDGTTLLVRFAPGGTGGFEANYEFTSRDGRISELNLQYA
ncbi:nuclear transport factor 2 family protein [Streptomyces sp. NPDC088789]|uniref:nuclear transport factor 2 family protein n=1 Tax=Streptomyces sp. NPDC088789 TaxID=3365899 RepID=UPI00382A82F7